MGSDPTSASSCSTRETRCSGANGYAPTPGSSRKGASITARRPSRRCSASSTKKWGSRRIMSASSRARATGCATRCRRTSSGATRAATTSGQKQIWFLLQLTGRDSDMNLRATDHPEFDAWRWNEYWIPLDVVIEFKRDVYQMALTELARFLPRGAQHNRYLRSGMRPHHREEAPSAIGVRPRRRCTRARSADSRRPTPGCRPHRPTCSSRRRATWRRLAKDPPPDRCGLRPARGCRGGSSRARR